MERTWEKKSTCKSAKGSHPFPVRFWEYYTRERKETQDPAQSAAGKRGSRGIIPLAQCRARSPAGSGQRPAGMQGQSPCPAHRTPLKVSAERIPISALEKAGSGEQHNFSAQAPSVIPTSSARRFRVAGVLRRETRPPAGGNERKLGSKQRIGAATNAACDSSVKHCPPPASRCGEHDAASVYSGIKPHRQRRFRSCSMQIAPPPKKLSPQCRTFGPAFYTTTKSLTARIYGGQRRLLSL